MTEPPDHLEPLRDAWTIGLNSGGNRLLRYAIDNGSLPLADALRISEAETTRSSAENLARRLEKADLLERIKKRPATYKSTALGEAVIAFIDEYGAHAPAPAHPTVVILDDEERTALQLAGFELSVDLRHAAVEIASLRRVR